jgi:CRP-like cAMP-binding protein
MIDETQFSQTDDTPFNDEERAFLDAQLPTLSPKIARALCDVAVWVDENTGHLLTLEDEENQRLVYLASGSAAITLKGQLIGRCEEGNFIGEITALDGGAATATAMLVRESRYFYVTSSDLKRLCMANPELRLTLERAMALDTRKKLMASNEALRQA